MLASTPRNHPSQLKKRGGADDSVDDRETPPDVFEPLNAEFGFTLDVAAARHNAKCARYYALGPAKGFDPRQLALFEQPFVGDPEALGVDGLAQTWAAGEVVWCNPPFSDIDPWVRKATVSAATVVMLLPANRMEQPWWQAYIEPYRDGRGCHLRVETRFLAGRRCFRNRGAEIMNRTSRNPPFGLVIVIWDRRQPS
jgi:hypothetical protein